MLPEIKEPVEHVMRGNQAIKKEPGTFEKEPGINFYNCEMQ